MKPYLILGVDPGNSGAWALLDPVNELILGVGNVHIRDGPKRKGQTREILKGEGLRRCLEQWKPLISRAVVERGQVREQESRWRAYKTGANVLLCVGLVQGAGVPYDRIKKVSPAVWKPGLGLQSHPSYQERKRIARAFASQQFPGVKFSRHDHAEAALIALWYARQVMRTQ